MKKTLTACFIAFSLSFIIIYVFWPFLITRDWANNSNIRKFSRKQHTFVEVITISIKMCEEMKLKDCNFQMFDFSKKTQSKLKRVGIMSINVAIQHDIDEIVVNANFYTNKRWYNRKLNNVTIEYHSAKKSEKPTQQIQNFRNAITYSICLGDGWFFYVDTDYI